MSLIGIDVGSSSVKIGAYRADGHLLVVVSYDLTPLHPKPGWWEQDAEDVWRATSQGMQALMEKDAIRHDPPHVIAISASGRENFLADANGHPLTHGVMGADVRGAEFEAVPVGSNPPELWTLVCGHLRERMDPAFRYLWWAKFHPELLDKARYFLGWHDFLTLRMCGRAVIDYSQAGRWANWDLERQGWATDSSHVAGVPAAILPEVLPWGMIIGEVKPELAADWGLPPGVKLANGSMDLNCCALGVGVTQAGTACMVSGSYENLLIPTSQSPTATLLLRGLSVTPHPGSTGRSIFAICPTGNAVLNQVREWLKLDVEEANTQLQQADLGPSPVMAIPYLSGAMLYWEEGRKARGTLVGLTLATTPLDIVKAFMESIAYDHVNTLSLLAEEQIPVHRFRATGGGTRSAWWTQLKADMANRPIEVMNQPEPGTLGAALLAGLATGSFTHLDEATAVVAQPDKIYLPDAARAALHTERLAYYRETVATLLREVY